MRSEPTNGVCLAAQGCAKGDCTWRSGQVRIGSLPAFCAGTVWSQTHECVAADPPTITFGSQLPNSGPFLYFLCYNVATVLS